MRTIRANILYGMVALIPIVAFLWVAYYAYDLWTAVLEPVSNRFGLTDLQSQLAAVGLAVLALLAVCFVIGTLVRTALGGWLFQSIESWLLRHIPGYEIVANLLRGFADDRSAYHPALIDLAGNGTRTLGFVMEQGTNETVTVFIPSAPLVTVGQIHVVARTRVQLLEASSLDAANCLGQWGVGLQRLAHRGPGGSTSARH